MKASLNNFLYFLRSIVTGGGRDAAGNPKADSGVLMRMDGVNLSQLRPAAVIADLTFNLVVGTANNALQALADGTTYANDVAAIRNNFADTASKVAEILAFLKGTADETSAKVLMVQENVDTVGTLQIKIPRNYDEATDILHVRVLASQLTVSTDNDVQLDATVYKKRPGVALSADLNPTIPSTILSASEQWIRFDLSGNSLKRDDIVYFNLITDGHNDTDGEEVLIHDIEVIYPSCIVSYDEKTLVAMGNVAAGTDLR